MDSLDAQIADKEREIMKVLSDAYDEIHAKGVIEGAEQMRDRVINLIRPCLDRQPDLQKIITAIEEMK